MLVVCARLFHGDHQYFQVRCQLPGKAGDRFFAKLAFVNTGDFAVEIDELLSKQSYRIRREPQSHRERSFSATLRFYNHPCPLDKDLRFEFHKTADIVPELCMELGGAT